MPLELSDRRWALLAAAALFGLAALAVFAIPRDGCNSRLTQPRYLRLGLRLTTA
jgi:hypothetical protein